MKNIYKLFIWFMSASIVFMSCDSEDDLIDERIADNPLPGELTGTAGSADFSTYVSIGNSLTAGLMDAALTTRSQQNAYPNLLAQRFALAGGGAFNLPDVNTNSGFNVSFNSFANPFDQSTATFGRLILDLSIPGPVPTSPGEALNMVPDADRAGVNNLGVPGMRMLELPVNGYDTLNPFFTRFVVSPNTSVLEQAIAKQPTFFTMWLGSNDVLNWATSGGVGEDGETNPAFDPIPGTLVSTTSFGATLTGAMSAMFGSNANLKGVLINVPNITLTPFFQAVSYDAIPMDSATAAATNLGYAGYNMVLNALTNPALGPLAITAEEVERRQISFAPGNNAVVVVDDQLTDISMGLDALLGLGAITAEDRAALTPLVQARQLKSVASEPGLVPFGLPAEILTLSAATELGTLADPNNPASVIGVGVPLGDNFTLTVDEIASLLTRTAQFNGLIAAEAAKYEGLVVFDANTFFTTAAINGGLESNGFTYAPDFSPNGVFSVDGLHINPAGHAIMTNQILELIGTSFGSDLPLYNATDFSTVLVN